MADSVVQVDLSDRAADFRRLALQPGMGLIDRSGAHAAILRKWLGQSLAEPSWDGNLVRYQIRGEDDGVLLPQRIWPLTISDCKGAFRGEIAAMVQKLEAAPAHTGTERALRHVMLERLKKFQTDPVFAAQSGALAKVLDTSGVWRLVWLWGFERKTSETGPVAICKKTDCRHLAVITEDRRTCPACGAKLKVPRSPLPMLAALLTLLLLAGSLGYWFTRPPVETPAELASVRGQVFSVLGDQPIAGARVRVAGSETETQTDAEGRFTLKDLPAESSFVQISAAGFQQKKLAADLSQKAPPFLKVALKGVAEMRGRVRDRIHQAPIANASVSLPAWGISIRTDERGEFQIADLPGGKTQIEVSAQGFQAESIQRVLNAEKPATLDLDLAGKGQLVGSVIDAVTLKPISQATVFLLNTPLTATTDEKGRFEIAGISTGAATIAVQAKGYQAEQSEQELKGTEVRPFRVGLYGAGEIRGRVKSLADGEPLAGVSVELTDPQFHRETKTNARGEFEFQKLPPGGQELRAAFAGFRDATANATVQKAGDTLEIALAGDASLTGLVTDAVEKKPVPQVEVRIAGTELVAKTGEDGKFQLQGIPGGKAIVRVVGRGYRQVELPEMFEVGQETKITVELKGGTILSGLVQDAETKSPLADAEVSLGGTMQKTKTDVKGRFRFEDIKAGTRTLNVAANGYRSAEQETELKTDEESTATIGLKGDAVLSGLVVSAQDEKPLAGANVKIAGSSREIPTDEEGRFRMENVPSGSLDLEITLAGYQPGRVSRDLAAGEETQVEILLMGAAGLVGSVVDQNGRTAEPSRRGNRRDFPGGFHG